MAKLRRKKMEKYPFYKEKSFGGLTPRGKVLHANELILDFRNNYQTWGNDHQSIATIKHQFKVHIEFDTNLNVQQNLYGSIVHSRF